MNKNINENIIENWDEIYKRSEIPPWESGKEERILEEILQKKLIKTGLTLDIGCGLGTDTIYLTEKGFRLIGLDCSIYVLYKASERLKNKNLTSDLCQGDALNLPFKNSIFDFINDRGCFHHIKKSSRKKYAGEIYRILKPGGKFLLRFFSENYYISGGAGQKLFKKDIFEIFKKRFGILDLYDYKGQGNKWPVDMSVCIMEKL